MLQINISSIDLNELNGKLEQERIKLEKIAYEKELKKKLLNEYEIRFSFLEEFSLNEVQKEDIRITNKSEYHISELLFFSDLDFIKNCYRAILNREADASGINYYLEKIRTGKLHKIDIIGRMYLSRESKLNDTKIKGIWPKFILRTLQRIPILGYILRLFISILRLPTIVKRNEILENQISLLISQENEQIYNKLNTLQENNNKLMKEINNNITMLETGLSNIVSEIKSKKGEEND